MRYFTAERLVRLQDRSDERQYLAALDEWDDALKKYLLQLNKIQQRLRTIKQRTPAFLKFLATISLHDARVLDMYWGGRGRFRITLHPQFQPGRLAILTYTLNQPPRIKPHILPEQVRSEPIAWLYDELTLDSSTGRDKPEFRHSILMSDGNELCLRFCQITVERPVPLVPAVPIDAASP